MPGGVNQVEGGEPEAESLGGAGIIEWGDAFLVELTEEPESSESGDKVPILQEEANPTPPPLNKFERSENVIAH